MWDPSITAASANPYGASALSDLTANASFGQNNDFNFASNDFDQFLKP